MVRADHAYGHARKARLWYAGIMMRPSEPERVEDTLHVEIAQDRAARTDPAGRDVDEPGRETRLARRKRFMYDLLILGFGFFGTVVFGSFVLECLFGGIPVSLFLFLFLSVLLIISLYLVVDGIRKLIR